MANQSAFDAGLALDLGGGKLGLLGIETNYHEHAVVELAPRPPAMAPYVEVTERSGAFVEGWRESVARQVRDQAEGQEARSQRRIVGSDILDPSSRSRRN